MENIIKVIENLKENDFFNNDVLIKIDNQIFNVNGKETSNSLFNNIKSKYAVFTYGEYSIKYAQLNKPLYACNDDAAQMFGHKINCVIDNPKQNSIIYKKGFVATGRTINEMIASAILIEKLCRIEILGNKTRKIHYLPSILCTLEHIVYLKSYSKKAIKNG